MLVLLVLLALLDRMDRMDRMALRVLLVPRVLEVTMVSTGSDIMATRESEGRQAIEDRREVQAPLDRPARA